MARYRGNPDCHPIVGGDGGWQSIEAQIDEDTCTVHGEFCCPQCFNMEPMGDPIDVPNGD